MLSLFRVTSNWDEDEVTYNTKPSKVSTTTDTQIVPSNTNVWMSFDIKDDLQLLLNGNYTNHGWEIIDLVSYGSSNIPITYFASKESSNLPYISIGIEVESNTTEEPGNETLSWVKITTPGSGDVVTSPIICEAAGSEDVDYVEYGFYHDGYWEGSVFYRAYETPYHYEWEEKLSPGETVKIRASSYYYTGNGGSHILSQSEIVEVTVSGESEKEDSDKPEKTDRTKITPFSITFGRLRELITIILKFLPQLSSYFNL